MRINIKTKIINESQVKKLLEECDKDTKRAVELAFYKGLSLSKILSKVKIIRRTLQYKIKKASMKALGFEVTFSQLRTSCIIYLLNQGYSSEDVTEILGYTRNYKMNKKAGIFMAVVIIIFVLAMLFMWKFGLFRSFFEFIKCLGKNKLECLK